MKWKDWFCRAKNIETNKFVYGDYLHEINTNGTERHLVFIGMRDKFGRAMSHEVDKDTIGMNTNIFDMNDHRVFVDDIVTFTYRKKTRIGVVTDVNDEYFIKDSNKEIFSLKRRKELKIIGNIFDNQDLLKEEQC